MAFSAVMNRFMELSPIPVMVRALLERVLTAEKLDECFQRATDRQYTRELLFSSVFELMSLVVTKTYSSINTAYKSEKGNLGVSITSVYNKLNGLEPEVSAAVVRDTALEMSAIIESLDAKRSPLLPGFRLKMLDGNCLAATDHRLKVLRDKAAGALPGKSLVVYDPALEMAVDVFPCEDGHAQERSLFPQVLNAIDRNDVWVMDRNFCVRSFLFGIEERGAYSICRHHKQVPYVAVGDLKEVGQSETGTVFEQWVYLEDESGTKRSRWRKIVVRLKDKTRNGDEEITILTNLPKAEADAVHIASLYRKRWTIETMFQQLESHLNSEIDALGYPKAALFGFCVALVAYNIMAVIKGSLRKIHGETTIDEEVSGYYIAGEIGRTHEGMVVAILPDEWDEFQKISNEAFLSILIELAQNVKLKKYKKNRRGPKKKPPTKTYSPKEPHVSTAKLLRLAKKSP